MHFFHFAGVNGCSQWPTSQCNELLNSDCCFIQCTVNRLLRKGRGGGLYYSSAVIGRCTRLLFAYWLLAVSLWICYRSFPRHSACTRKASRHVTAWRLSGVCLKLIKLEMEFLHLYCSFARMLPVGNGGDFFCLSFSRDAFVQEPPRSAINIFQINAVKVFFLLQSIRRHFFMHR